MAIKFVKIAAIILLFSFGLQKKAHCQLYFAEDMINVKGQLIDAVTKEGIGYAQVINMRVRGGAMTDALGNFSVQADPSDTLLFKSLSYKDKKVPVRDITGSENENVKIMLSPSRILLGEVGVESTGPKVNMSGIPLGKSVSVPVELRSDYFANRPKNITAIIKPMSFLAYHFSKDEKEKRATLTAIHSERDWSVLSLVYNKEVIQRISGLSGDGLEDFMLYCNAYNALPVNATSYDVEKRIRELMVEYVEKNSKGK